MYRGASKLLLIIEMRWELRV